MARQTAQNNYTPGAHNDATAQQRTPAATEPTPVALVPALNSPSQYPIRTTWHRGMLLVGYDANEIDADTAAFVAGIVAGGPIRVVYEYDTTAHPQP